MAVDVLVEDDGWADVGLPALAEAATAATLRQLGLDPDAFEISLLGCDDARIADLNRDFRGKPQPTNVLSWPSEERGASAPGLPPGLPQPIADAIVELGDIAIAYGTCTREAAAAGRPVTAHVTHLLVHGTLHLLGYDHIIEEDAALMEGLEIEILATLGLPDPYKD
jgi:probable rRNA maturation factor